MAMIYQLAQISESSTSNLVIHLIWFAFLIFFKCTSLAELQCKDKAVFRASQASWYILADSGRLWYFLVVSGTFWQICFMPVLCLFYACFMVVLLLLYSCFTCALLMFYSVFSASKAYVRLR